MGSQYIQLADVTAPGATSAQVQNAILDASGEADSYIKKRYTLPLLKWGNDLRSAVRRMARYYALGDRGFDPTKAADQAVVSQYRDAIAWLKQIASQEAELVDVTDSSPENDEASPLHEGENPRRWLWGSKAASEDD
jgi:phage gp36-like protein